MFGTFRVLLAILVLLSHVFVGAYFNYGVSAVIGFLIISGYVMTILIRNNYGKIGKSTWYFYADRFLRIYPQYFLFITISVIADVFWYFPGDSLSGQASPWKFFLNALVVPMNYFMFLPDSIMHYQIIPAAWSLGLEEQFYWIFPLIVLISWFGRLATIASFGIFLIAVLGVLNSELFAFRFLPGVIFIFLLGKNLAEYNVTKSNASLWTLLSLYTATLALLLYLWIFAIDRLLANHNKEVLVGILVGLPIIAILSRIPRQKWDETLGHSSYGIFLCHLLVLNILVHFKLFMNGYFQFLIALITISIATGFAGYYLVEKMVNPFRHALRRKHTQAISSPESHHQS